jgi:hypothetical protein
MDVNNGLSRENLLERVSKAPQFEELKKLSDGELLAEYCEAMVAALNTEAAGDAVRP